MNKEYLRKYSELFKNCSLNEISDDFADCDMFPRVFREFIKNIDECGKTDNMVISPDEYKQISKVIDRWMFNSDILTELKKHDKMSKVCVLVQNIQIE
jgi:hypothetical protein